jgi:hypothetical protein
LRAKWAGACPFSAMNPYPMSAPRSGRFTSAPRLDCCRSVAQWSLCPNEHFPSHTQVCGTDEPTHNRIVCTPMTIISPQRRSQKSAPRGARAEAHHNNGETPGVNAAAAHRSDARGPHDRRGPTVRGVSRAQRDQWPRASTRTARGPDGRDAAAVGRKPRATQRPHFASQGPAPARRNTVERWRQSPEGRQVKAALDRWQPRVERATTPLASAHCQLGAPTAQPRTARAAAYGSGGAARGRSGAA